MNEAYPDPLSIETTHSSRTLDEDLVSNLIRHVLDAENAQLVHVSVVLADHDLVRRLNRSYLEHDYNTDVLSFSLREERDDHGPVPVEGEVYVDLDTAADRHDEFGTSFEHEACRYVVHGLLHLLGYDDAMESEAETMREKEDQYLDEVFSARSE